MALKFEHLSARKHLDIASLYAIKKAPVRATHLVAEVNLGWDAFFVFEKKIENGLSQRQTMNKLELMAAKLAHSTNFVDSEFDETFCKGVTCKFLADSQINMPPSNFIEAVETFKSLNASPPSGIIKSAHLYPVSKLGVSKTVVGVGSDVVEEVEGLLSGYNKVQNELANFIACNTNDWPDEDVQLFEHLLQTVLSQIGKSLQNLVPQIRESIEPWVELSFLIQKYRESSFSPKNFRLCFETISSTSNILSKFLRIGREKSVDFVVGSQFQELKSSLTKDQVIDVKTKITTTKYCTPNNEFMLTLQLC